ncbi:MULTISPECIES: PASTA domain-containing protein [unclassified Adlercreutzia]|uniref:PASTA domain-containing protein n=1 Tax=unclassified Adlercreutzia TaxID=2636013 RepID=UPI0013ED4CF9|nr:MULTISPECIES: PASTA domain-containing protein [unclassified Adlercreutzia]
MICPNCKTENRAEAKFCDECGCDLRALAAEEAAASGKAAAADGDAPAACAGKDAPSGTSAAPSPADAAPNQVIAEALGEVRALRDAVPPVIKVPTIVSVPDIAIEDAPEPDAKELAKGSAKELEKAAAAPAEANEASGKAASSDEAPALAEASASAKLDAPAVAKPAKRAVDSTPAVAKPATPAVDGTPAADAKEPASFESRPDTPFAEARAMFGPKGISAEVTADLSGLERLVDSSYVPPSSSGRAGDTMELPRIEEDPAPRATSFRAEVDRKEARRQKRAQRKLEREQAKRARELQKQGAVAAPGAHPALEDLPAVEPEPQPEAIPEAGAAPEAMPEPAPAPEVLAGAATDTPILADAPTEAPAGTASAPERVTSADHADQPSDPHNSAASAGSADVPDAPVRPRPRKAVVAGIVVACAVICAAIALCTYHAELWGGKVIPDVAGKSQADARYLLEEKGFTTMTTQVKSDEVEGLVLETDPAAGQRADKGSEITLRVATARIVPEVVGKPQAEVEKLMAEEGFGNVEYVLVKSNEPEGTALSVAPEPGTRAKAGEPVTVEVAQAYTVPEVRDLSTADATRALEAEGYKVTTEQYNTEDLPEGTAVSTDPLAGTKLPSGSAVTLYVAHNRSTDLIEFTRAFFTDSPVITYAGKVYNTKPDTIELTYVGNNTVNFSIQGVEVGFIFGIAVENPSGQTTLKGSITWDDDNNIVSTTPVMKQGA